MIAATVALAATAVTGGTTAATPVGVGTARAATSVLQVQLGDGSLLRVRLGGDDSRATTDRAVTPASSAFSRLAPLEVDSSVDALNIRLPIVQASSPDGSPEVTTPTVDLTTPATSGRVEPASLRAAVDDDGARASLTTKVSGVGLAGGLVAADSLEAVLRTTAAGNLAASERGVSVGRVSVLDLGALLDGLGLSLTDLPLDVLSALLDELGLDVPGLASGSDLASAAAALDRSIADVQAVLAAQTAQAATTVDQAVSTAVGGIIGSVGSTVTGVLGGGAVGGTGTPALEPAPVTLPAVPTVGAALGTLNATIDGLRRTLADLLSNALATLDGVALLSVSGVDVGVTTVAAETVDGSVAAVSGGVGSLTVGGLTLPGLTLSSTLDDIAARAAEVTDTVAGALAAVDPGLAGVVSVRLLEQAKGVTTDGGYVRSLASLTAVVATVTPPAELDAIVAGIVSARGVGDILAGLPGGAAPVLSAAMPALETTLGVVRGLAGGATVRVAQVTSSSEFSPRVAPTPLSAPDRAAPAPVAAPAGELPRTGHDGALPAVAGVLSLAAGLGLVRWLRRPAPTT